MFKGATKIKQQIKRILADNFQAEGAIVKVYQPYQATVKLQALINEARIDELEGLKLEYMQCLHCKGAHLIASATEPTIKERLKALKTKNGEQDE